MNELFACPQCERHIRRSESACPFCKTELSDAFREQADRPRPMRRLGRAALYTFAASSAIAGSVVACVNSVYGAPAPDDAGADASDAAVPTPVYGSPALDGGNLEPAYGGPPSDAGHD